MSMDQSDVLAKYRELGEQEKVRFLLMVCHWLTVGARDAYSEGTVENPAKLVQANEVQHRLTGIALEVVGQRCVRTDTEIAAFLFTGFAEVGALDLLEEVIKGWPLRGG